LQQPELTRLKKPLSLVGMPGGGKSTVGRHLAKRLGASFVDSDFAVERRLGCSIRAFFETEGEDRFREIESAMVEELIEASFGVIATGGGAVLRASSREMLRDRTVCVYLRSSPEDLMRRLRHDIKRPILQVRDPLAKLRELYAVRDPLYRQTAQFVIETGRPAVPALTNIILMQLELAGVIDSFDVPSPIDSTVRLL
jgi:shikimate kinase